MSKALQNGVQYVMRHETRISQNCTKFWQLDYTTDIYNVPHWIQHNKHL